MSKKCETVIISDKAYNAMIRESFAKHPVETGGILLGYILDNGLWVVMEMIPPGIDAIFETAYFEYDQAFVNYLGTSVANQYKEPLQVLGLWHRHPGSMDYFSSTDDGTNSEFASKNPYGVISGLVNIDPSFRLTMYHLDHNDGVRPRNIAYSTVDVEVGDDLIPENFFALRYVDEDHTDLHPTPTHTNTQVSKTRNIPRSPRNKADEVDEPAPSGDGKPTQNSGTPVIKKSGGRKWRTVLIAVAMLIIGIIIGFMLGSPSGDGLERASVPNDTTIGASDTRSNDTAKVAPGKGKDANGTGNEATGTGNAVNVDGKTGGKADAPREAGKIAGKTPEQSTHASDASQTNSSQNSNNSNNTTHDVSHGND